MAIARREVCFGAIKFNGLGREVVIMFPDAEVLANVMRHLPCEHRSGLITFARPIDGDEAAVLGTP